MQSQIQVMDKRLFGVANIHKSSIQGGKYLLDLAKINIPHREAVTLARFSVELDQAMVLQQRQTNLCRAHVDHKVFFKVFGLHFGTL